MRSVKFFVLALFLILAAAACESLSDTQASGPECSVIVKNALDATNQICDGTGRNQACYGHVQVRAEPQPGAGTFKFDRVGEKVDVAALKSLHLSPMDTSEGTWGVALMHLQANLPDTQPGENVTLLLFGDVQIRNIVPMPTLLNVVTTSGGNVNVRREPSQEAFVLGTLPPNTAVTARGRSEDNAWIYIDLPKNSGRGWISSTLVTTDGTIQSLNPIKPYLADAKPMQAFYLRTGEGASTCAEAPNDGLVIQTPEGEAEVRLWINEVKIRLKSTVFVQARANKPMSITTLEGEVHVEAMRVEQAVPVGSSVTVQLNTNQVAAAPPSAPQRVPRSIMPTLPPVQTPQKTDVPVAPTVVADTPTAPPTNAAAPTLSPTNTETRIPTRQPTDVPTNTPASTEQPTNVPTNTPASTEPPTDAPVNTPVPTNVPTDIPVPTNAPASTQEPLALPTDTPASTQAPAYVPPSNTPADGNGSQGQSTATPIPPASPEGTASP